MSSIAKRLDMHFVAMAAVGAVAAAGTAQHADAAIVYSGVLNLPINADIDGIYLNLVTGQTGTSSGAVAGNDINPYVSGGWIEFGRTGSSFFSSDASTVTDATGVVISSSSTFIGSGSFNGSFANTAVLGLRFLRESDNATLNGWVRLTLPASGPGTLVDYAYDNAGGAVTGGVVPAPTAGMGLLALGGAGLLGRRRK